MQDRYTRACGVPCAYCAAGREPATDSWPPERLAHLYLCRELSTRRIAELTGINRQRVTRVLHGAGVPVHPRGVGRFRPLRRRTDPPGLQQLITELYETAKLSSRQIAAVTGVSERTVRDRLHRYGIRVRNRGGWNREDRRVVPAEILHSLYEQLGHLRPQDPPVRAPAAQVIPVPPGPATPPCRGTRHAAQGIPPAGSSANCRSTGIGSSCRRGRHRLPR